MSGKIDISRKLGEKLADLLHGHGVEDTDAANELRALLAAPVVERQPPIAYMRNEGTPNNLVKCTFICDGAFGVYREPVAVADLDVDQLAQIIRTVDCNHSLGAGALAERILDKVKELNQ